MMKKSEFIRILVVGLTITLLLSSVNLVGVTTRLVKNIQKRLPQPVEKPY